MSKENNIKSAPAESKGAYPELPRVAVGTVVIHSQSILLVQRGTPPARGEWSIPGGKIRLGETMQEAAEREVLEETGIVVRAGDPVLTFDLIQRDKDNRILFHYIIVDLWAKYLSGSIRSGTDALQAAWIHQDCLDKYSLSPKTRDLLNRCTFA